MANGDNVEVIVNGSAYEGWVSYCSRHSFDKAVGTLDLAISPQPGSSMPIKLGDQIVCKVQGRPVLTGYVHEVDGDDDWDQDVRTIHARDMTQDFVDSTVGPQKPVEPPATLQQILQQTVRGMGLSFGVLDNVNPDKFESGEVPSGGIEEKGHEFADRLARQRQVLLNTDGNGNLVIDRNTGRRGGGQLFRAAPEDHRSDANNIKKARYRNTDLNRHNLSGVFSQHSTNDQAYWEDKPKDFGPAQAGPLSKEYGVGYDNNVRPERRQHVRARHSLQRGKTKGAAAWRSNVAKGRGFQYIATVQGFDQAPGDIWWPGLIVPVYDYKYEIEAELLIVDVQFRKTWKGGSLTELTFTYADAYSDKDGTASAKTGRTSSLGSGAPGTFANADPGDLEGVPPD